jgi:hypothetical protein
MNKFLSVLVAGLIAGSLSVSAFAADAAKAVPAATAKPVVAAVKTTDVKTEKKETGIKASLKKLLPSAKKTEAK